MPALVMLGPQRFTPTLNATLRDLRVEGPLAVVTAGWQEREAEDDELREHCDREVIDLLLWARAERALEADRELAVALRRRQQLLRRNQELYSLRLDALLGAARTLLRREDDGSLLDAQRNEAVRQLRTVDRQHLRRIHEIHEEFDETWRPVEREGIARVREELRAAIDGCGAVGIAGGHVAVLLNRIRLFGLREMIAAKTLVTWSAGAMAVADRVVLFHDHPPQGAGNAEVLDRGLGLGPRLLPLPHARARLRLDDRRRMTLFARRFAALTCVLLDVGARVDWDGTAWRAGRGTRRVTRAGLVREMA